MAKEKQLNLHQRATGSIPVRPTVFSTIYASIPGAWPGKNLFLGFTQFKILVSFILRLI